MAYGYNIEPDGPDVLVNLIEKMMAEFSIAAVPMSWAVDILPFLQYLPDNFPGATFKKTARRWRRSIHASAYIPYQFVQRQMAALTHRQSYVSKLIGKLKDDGGANLTKEDEEAVVWTAASLYGAAADTTTITLTNFTLAMIKFRDVQRKAQEEIDRVVGADRLPTFEDQERLPYINALVKEIIRWRPVAPMGFPHTATEDVNFNDLHIRKGASIMPAVWWFLHDPEVYANPDLFDPERFLPPRNEPDPSTEAFGYGRRICAGRFFAEAGLYINIAQSLATFEFSKAVGEDGYEVEVNDRPKPGILSYPTPFKFQIKPRSQKHIDLIREIERNYPRGRGDAKLLDSIEDFEARY
jgi:cytochrome P450